MATSNKSFRYGFPARSIKGDCPDCGQRHRKTLSRYIDTFTGDALPEEYGICDRVDNCGYNLSPYTKGTSGMSYADQIFEQSKKDSGRMSFDLLRRTEPRPTPTIHTIPDEYFTRSLSHYEDNQFARLLVCRFGEAKAEQLLQQFKIGTSTRWPGANVFWLIDEQDRVRGGQIKNFAPDFHTAKYIDREGNTRSSTSWVHSALQYQFERRQESVPLWLVEYGRDADKAPCLFGLPQLKTTPPDKPVAIVESPKTAVICSAYLTDFVWLAVMGKSYLKPERMEAVRGRRIVLYPDLNAYYDTVNEKGHRSRGWLTIAGQLRAAGFTVEISDFLETHATPEQKQAGLDLADFLLAPEVDRPIEQSQPTAIRKQTFYEWSCQSPAFSFLGLAALRP